MEEYKIRLARVLAETGALFFDKNLRLKDGRPTPYFVNMAMFRSGRLAFEMGSFFAGMMIDEGLVGKTDIILGPSYKGSSIAVATAIALWIEQGIDLQFDYDRKEAKTHGEASAAKSMFVNQTLFEGCRMFVVDDVATSMATKFDLLEKIEADAAAKGVRCHVQGIGIAIDREQTTAVYDESGRVIPGKKGGNAIQEFVAKSGIPVYRVAGIREVVTYLFEERVPVTIGGQKAPLDEETMRAFETYTKTYGVDE